MVSRVILTCFILIIASCVFSSDAKFELKPMNLPDLGKVWSIYFNGDFFSYLEYPRFGYNLKNTGKSVVNRLNHIFSQDNIEIRVKEYQDKFGEWTILKFNNSVLIHLGETNSKRMGMVRQRVAEYLADKLRIILWKREKTKESQEKKEGFEKRIETLEQRIFHTGSKFSRDFNEVWAEMVKADREFSSGNLIDALSAYQKAFSFNKKHFWSCYLSGKLLFLGKNFQEAIYKMNESIQLMPKDPRSYFLRAMCYYQLKDYLTAQRGFKKTLIYARKSATPWIPLPELYDWIGLMHQLRGEGKQAERYYRSGVRLSHQR